MIAMIEIDGRYCLLSEAKECDLVHREAAPDTIGVNQYGKYEEKTSRNYFKDELYLDKKSSTYYISESGMQEDEHSDISTYNILERLPPRTKIAILDTLQLVVLEEFAPKCKLKYMIKRTHNQ